MKRDAAATRIRIFTAASDEFAQYGIAGARVDRIAKSARANKAQIYEYFGPKEKLFENVLEHELLRLITEVTTPQKSGDIPEFVGKAFDFHVDHPNLVRLLHWEALYFGSRQVPGEAGRTAFYRERSERLGQALASEAGDEKFDPRHLHFILVSMATSWFAMPQLARFHLNEDAFSEQSLAEHRRHIVEITSRILQL